MFALGLAIAALVLVTILLLTKSGNALLCNIAVLLGIVAGTLVAVVLNAWFNGIRGTQELMRGGSGALTCRAYANHANRNTPLRAGCLALATPKTAQAFALHSLCAAHRISRFCK